MENKDYYEKYDRQIRLWGLKGCEILKGLCLAGLNSITVFDTHRVTQDDVESSFFLSSDSISRNRAEVTIETIGELGNSIDAKIGLFEDHLPHSDLNESQEKRSHNYWEQFSAVIVCGNLYRDQMTSLSHICWNHNIPLIVTHCIGFFGYIQIQAKNHKIFVEKSTNDESYWTKGKESEKQQPFTTTTISDDWRSLKEKKLKILEDEEELEFVNLFLGFKSIEAFFSTYGRDLDYQENEIETNFLKLKESSRKLLHSTSKSFDQCLFEFCRVAEIELLATCAFLGGCAAQEVIKLITNLYQPVDNILVYNATTASTKNLKLAEYLI